MPGRVVMLHGWSATADSMRPLKAFLQANGFKVSDLWLGEYVSLDDDVRIPDVIKRMRRVLLAEIDRLGEPFDMIVHSTGGLVARDWIASLVADNQSIPLRRLLMLAPANFGSALAAKGKSFVGRVIKGWDNWLQTGVEMLNELELASAYQWDLAVRDVLSPDGATEGPYGPGRILPFVICGTRGFSSGLKQIVNEAGSDSTVRPAAANLNATGLTIDFSANPDAPEVRPWASRLPVDVPFAVLPDRTHGTILEPMSDTGATTSGELARLILQALSAREDGRDYAQIAEEWDKISEDTAATGTNSGLLNSVFKGHPPDPQDLHQYLQVALRVRDDQGYPVNDYFVEFFSPQEGGEEDSAFFHQSVLDSVKTNSLDASRRCFFIDRTDLYYRFYDGVRKQVAMSLSAAPIGNNIRYFDSTKEGARGHLVIHDADLDARETLPGRLRRNRTHLVEIIIPRQPIDKVFSFAQ